MGLERSTTMGSLQTRVFLLIAMVVSAYATSLPLYLGIPSTFTTTQCGGYSYYTVEMVDPCADLVVSVAKSTGEPKIFVSK